MTEANQVQPCRFCNRDVQPYGYYRYSGTCKGCVQCSTSPARSVRNLLHNLEWSAKDGFRAGVITAKTYGQIRKAWDHNDPRLLPEEWKIRYMEKARPYGLDRFAVGPSNIPAVL